MIEITIKENITNMFHNDLHFRFLFSNRVEIGDTYWFLNSEGNNTYDNIKQQVSSYFRLQIKKVKELKVGKKINIYYLIFDECECGIQLLNLNENDLLIKFMIKLKFETEILKIENESYLVKKNEFINSFTHEVDNLSK